MSLKDLIKAHSDSVFMNILEFADNLDVQIDGTCLNIKGSLQANTVQNNSGNNYPLQSIGWTLYTKYPLCDNYELHTGESITINDVVYKVDGISDEMGIATIKLHKGGYR